MADYNADEIDRLVRELLDGPPIRVEDLFAAADALSAAKAEVDALRSELRLIKTAIAIDAEENQLGAMAADRDRLSARVRELELTEEEREAARWARSGMVDGPFERPVSKREINHNRFLALLDRLVKGGR